MFYRPKTAVGQKVLRFAQQLGEKYRGKVTVLGMAMSDDEELVRKEYEEMHLTFPVLDGSGLHQTYSVDATPRLVVIDGDGVLHGGYTGWGIHTPHEVGAELQRCLEKARP